MTQFYFMKTWLQARIANDERGANMVEYVLLLALIALAAVVAITWLGGMIRDSFNSAGSELDGAV